MRKGQGPLVNGGLAGALMGAYADAGGTGEPGSCVALPSGRAVEQLVGRLRELVFPELVWGGEVSSSELEARVQGTLQEVALTLRREICAARRYVHRGEHRAASCVECEVCSDEVPRQFLDELPSLRRA